MPFLQEVAARLEDAGVGTRALPNRNIFLSRKAIIPSGDGPYLSLVETGGTEPRRIHAKAGSHTQRPTAQVLVRAADYPAARLMAVAAYNALNGIWNTTLSGTFYVSLKARQEPTDIGLEEGTARAMVSFNIEAEKAPS